MLPPLLSPFILVAAYCSCSTTLDYGAFAVMCAWHVVRSAAQLREMACDVQRIRRPQPYADFRDDAKCSPLRPWRMVFAHAVLFHWNGHHRSWLKQRVLRLATRYFDDWDVPFRRQGRDPASEVLRYCDFWGVARRPWPWVKHPREYDTMNEFFARRYAKECLRIDGRGVASMPADAQMTWYPRCSDMPRKLKNDDFEDLESMLGPRACNVVPASRFASHPAALCYLSPADYHRFHCPADALVRSVQGLSLRAFSTTVQAEVFGKVNVLRSNRRFVVMLELLNTSGDAAPLCAMIIVGATTVDSIRLDPSVAVGQVLCRGQDMGAFARGGSMVALLFTQSFALDESLQQCMARHSTESVKLNVGTCLCH